MMRVVYLLVAAMLLTGVAAHGQPVTVGSKSFTESVVLGDIARLSIEDNGETAVHRRAMGGTRILHAALRRGEIDVYPDYTGTLRFEVYAGEGVRTLADLRERLAKDGLAMTEPAGFDNSYAVAMQPGQAERLGIETISDLRAHPELVLGLSNEFMDRADGWRALKAAYGLPQSANGLQHDLAYRGIAEGNLDVIDVYVTDPEIAYYELEILNDDRNFFPGYEAVFLYRVDLAERRPAAVEALERLAGRIGPARMRAMNKAVKLDGEEEAAVAARFLNETFSTEITADAADGMLQRIWTRLLEHLWLVAVSLSGALLAAVPLGIAAHRFKRGGGFILSAVGILQTVPALALFVFMIPPFGIGAEPTIAALFLYSLLPIVRNTHAGLSGIPADLRDSALAMGLSARSRLLKIELPLALPTMLAGIKTAAVINVGIATLGALIGAGGLGQPILTGIRLDDVGLIFQGAIPAALLALVVTGAFELLGRWLIPRGLKLEAASR